MPDDGYVSLATLKGGAAIEAVDHALGEVWDNILDPNTAPRAKRSVTLKLTFSPTEDRESAGCNIEIASKLAPQAPMTAQIIVDQEDGRAVAAEFGRRNPGQHTLEGVYEEAKNVTPIKKTAEA
jgi:hypothetical protein